MAKSTVNIFLRAVSRTKSDVIKADARSEYLLLTYPARLLQIVEDILITQEHDQCNHTTVLMLISGVRPWLWNAIAGGSDEQE